MNSNRITSAIADMDLRIKGLDDEARDSLELTATLDQSDWLLLGDKASLASLHGIVTADEAMVLYRIHSAWNTSSVAERVTYLRAMGEILPRLRHV